jgi:hypothetical protein
MFKGRNFLFIGLPFLLLLLWLFACKDSSPGGQGVVLMKLGNRVVTVNDYKEAFEMAMSAYPMKALADRNHIKVAKVRLLNQMTDELVILHRADALQLIVSDEELNSSIDNILKDYPDQTFDQILVEQSISFNRWKESLRKRLLIEKTIREDTRGLSDSVGDSKPSVALRQQEQKNEPNPPEQQEGSVEGEPYPEGKSAQDIYAAWMARLRKTHPVYIDENQWEAILEE